MSHVISNVDITLRRNRIIWSRGGKTFEPGDKPKLTPSDLFPPEQFAEEPTVPTIDDLLRATVRDEIQVSVRDIIREEVRAALKGTRSRHD